MRQLADGNDGSPESCNGTDQQKHQEQEKQTDSTPTPPPPFCKERDPHPPRPGHSIYHQDKAGLGSDAADSLLQGVPSTAIARHVREASLVTVPFSLASPGDGAGAFVCHQSMSIA